MSIKEGSNTLVLEKPISVKGYGNVVGTTEGKGPMKDLFDQVLDNDDFEEKSFEKAESKLQKTAVEKALGKAGMDISQIDLMAAGDLLNQCISSNYSARDNNVPFIGLYGACSTMALSIAVSALAIESGFAKNAVAVTSSHFCSAERQFRFPLEYGGQRTPSAQRTVTGSGAVVLDSGPSSPVRVKSVTIGSIVDFGITDINNMGAAMAPAAVDTLARFFTDTMTKPDDYDLILTGDLGHIGSAILRDMIAQRGFPISNNLNDCGLMIYDVKKQDAHAGGSGCGASASVLTAYVIPEMMANRLKNVLFMSTGALMSPTSNMQGESIPSIAHLINFVRED